MTPQAYALCALGALALIVDGLPLGQATHFASAAVARPQLARIFFYRPNDFAGTPEWTSVWLNAAKVGESAPGSYFYRDVQPGTYAIGLQSERTNLRRSGAITIAPGSTSYVEIYSVDDYEPESGGFYYRPVIFAERVVDPTPARAAIVGLEQQR